MTNLVFITRYRNRGRTPWSGLVFGATNAYPLRALGYVASAVVLGNTFFPKAEVQLVHTVHTGERVNGVNRGQSLAAARRFASLARRALDGYSDPAFLTDPEESLAVDEMGVAEAVFALPPGMRDKLLNASAFRGDMISYVAAHLQLHDTKAPLLTLDGKEAPQNGVKRIISLGAQSERPFYMARMACRKLGIDLPDGVEETGQVFTRHVLPPYIQCREGEPDIEQINLTHPLRHPLEFAADPLYDRQPHPNNSVERDLVFVTRFLAGLEDPSVRSLEDLLKRIDEMRRQKQEEEQPGA